jgi:hypothetical protein
LEYFWYSTQDRKSRNLKFAVTQSYFGLPNHDNFEGFFDIKYPQGKTSKQVIQLFAKVLTVHVFNSKLLQYDSKPGEAILSVIHRAKGVTGRGRLVIYHFATQKQNFGYDVECHWPALLSTK